ncbi:preprotein translocase subunit SecF [Actinomadura rubteroloni]|uniref:Protein-export membrane protein SecF n=1 Tax=Actinomadura rubteroloni TaxID=1926885 RepID=A0A2P4UDX3_9ACTN|nr:protein translocase subunit SecF [Actinomadura rubteroloni]POM23226.1 preprotein translocase subunit SecF [Actinomadura rubteroloni]
MALGGMFSRIYRGEISADIVGRPKVWYSISGLLIALSVVGLLVQSLNFGVEFKGGSVFTFNAPHRSIEQVRSAVEHGGAHQVIVQKAGGDWRATTESMPSAEAGKIKNTISAELGIPAAKVSTQVVGASWGGEISKKAWQALAVFLLLIILYLSVAFEWRMALAALVALLHDLVITAGVYAWSGFEVTPATLLGFLTILGYSLYDAVVVFDMIKEVTRPLSPTSKITYSEAANRALSSTLVRSLNTSLVAILPVGAILFIGTTVFGAGTLKDLSLALFVGMIVGTYSSICVATPLLVQLKEREPQFRELRANIARRENSAKRQAKAARTTVPAGGGGDATDDDEPGEGEKRIDVASDVTLRKVVQTGPRQQPKRGTRTQRRNTK